MLKKSYGRHFLRGGGGSADRYLGQGPSLSCSTEIQLRILRATAFISADKKPYSKTFERWKKLKEEKNQFESKLDITLWNRM